MLGYSLEIKVMGLDEGTWVDDYCSRSQLWLHIAVTWGAVRNTKENSVTLATFQVFESQ